MSRIRHISIRHFRGISELDWAPRSGINAMIGSGDVGKSTVLDAIQFALSGSRREPFFDTDFYNLDAHAGLLIRITVGALPDELRDVDRYGDYLRGWISTNATIEDEPSAEAEDVLTLQLAVGADLDGVWSLHSERTEGNDPRDLSLTHRALLTPVVLDRSPDSHLRWTRQSILQRLATPQLAVRTLVAEAARSLREQRVAVDEDLDAVVAQVRAVGTELGIPAAQQAALLLDAFGSPTWAATLGLHDAAGVPLRRLGTGSARLLVSGLFRSQLARDGIALLDEVEHGLEPHRISRLLRLLGTNTEDGPQVFITSHSPVVIRELVAGELAVLQRDGEGRHRVFPFPSRVGEVDMQALVRACPEALLAPSVLVGEGATEVGLLRGMDMYWSTQAMESFALLGIAVADGGGIPYAASRSSGLAQSGYRTMLFMDDDRPLAQHERASVDGAGVAVLSWGGGHSTEQALFSYLAWEDVLRLIDVAQTEWSAHALDEHIRSHSNGQHNLASCQAADDPAVRALLGRVAKAQSWFKRIDLGMRVGQLVVGPALARAHRPLVAIFEQLRAWIDNG